MSVRIIVGGGLVNGHDRRAALEKEETLKTAETAESFGGGVILVIEY